MKNIIVIIFLVLILTGCLTFNSSSYELKEEGQLNKNVHLLDFIYTEDYVNSAPVTKFTVEPNDSMAPAFEESILQSFQTSSPFNFIDNSSSEVIERDLYILISISKQQCFYTLISNYTLMANIKVIDGKGNVYINEDYFKTSESSWGTHQSAQDKAVEDFLDSLYSYLSITDFDNPLNSTPEMLETNIELIKANM